jgi:purine-cytosine permease-like protein
MTLVYIALTIDTINWSAVTAIKDGPTQGFIGALIFGVTGIGLGWVNCAADYSRYLPRSVSSKAVVGWTVFGASVVPIILVIYGAALSASSKDLSEAIAMDPIGALTSLLPTWFLIPFALVAILGLVGGAILDLYSSGLALVSIGVPIKRHQAAIIDAFIMLVGCIYIVWVADNFFYPFQGFSSHLVFLLQCGQQSSLQMSLCERRHTAKGTCMTHKGCMDQSTVDLSF